MLGQLERRLDLLRECLVFGDCVVQILPLVRKSAHARFQVVFHLPTGTLSEEAGLGSAVAILEGYDESFNCREGTGRFECAVDFLQ